MSLPVHEPKLSFVDIVFYIALALLIGVTILCFIVFCVMTIRMITGSSETGSKFCPECGHTYNATYANYCERDGAALKEIVKE